MFFFCYVVHIGRLSHTDLAPLFAAMEKAAAKLAPLGTTAKNTDPDADIDDKNADDVVRSRDEAQFHSASLRALCDDASRAMRAAVASARRWLPIEDTLNKDGATTSSNVKHFVPRAGADAAYDAAAKRIADIESEVSFLFNVIVIFVLISQFYNIFLF